MSLPVDQHLLAALLDTIPDRIYFKDPEGRFLAVSKAFLEFINLSSPEELLGKTDFDIFLAEHAREAFEDEQQVIRTGKPVVGKVEREVWRDGRIRWVSTNKAPMRDDQGRIIGTCGISRDITEEHNQEEKLKEYAAALALRHEEVEQEMVLAREIQNALMPESFPTFKGAADQGNALKFHHRYLPAGAVGGDFFSVQKLSETKAGILISDVMGHGAHAALITAIERVLVEELQRIAHDPGLFLTELNLRLCQILKGVENRFFVTASYLVLETTTGAVQLASAAHPFPLLVDRKKTAVTRMGQSCSRRSCPLGMIEDSVYQTFHETISSGSTLLLYTDGLSDICGPEGIKCGEEDLIQAVETSASLQGEALLDKIIGEVREKSGNVAFQDDVCLLSVDL